MTSQSPAGYPGKALGFPRAGPGSLAPTGRRLAALCLDWLLSYGLALLGLGVGAWSHTTLSTAVLVIWLLLGVVAVRLFGFTPGQLLLGLVVVAADGRPPVGVGRLLARGMLLALVVPALFTDTDGRGLHDRLTGTAVVRR
ncbi:RDD family protein [Mycobacterium simiae]|uniref:RDD family protein n=1 Tax=Mycobacterium simiae TaxID=1784 RepID=A0A5B1BV14_MYCSI|nr:RDD family protein [Mycobacterium simiae]KAA1252186.1 RDD family protein [Mycobacterium simiae]